jgi:acyl-CoA thioester hydrolase
MEIRQSAQGAGAIRCAQKNNETTFRVRYAETDQMGVVYYANYFIWMELGRVEYCRSIGMRYRDMEEQDGVLLAVIDAQCRYRRPARYDDEVTVRTWVGASTRKAVEFSYEMYVREELIASGRTKHLFLGRDFRPVSLPVKYRAMFGVRGRE